MDKGFIKYVKNARREFVRDVDEQLWDTELRTSAENLIIAYDQMVSKLEQCNGKETPDELPASNCIKPAVLKSVCRHCGCREWHKQDDGYNCNDCGNDWRQTVL